MRPTGVMIDDVLTGRRRMALKGQTDRVQSVRFSPDGLSVASCSNDGSVRAWDLMTRRGWQLKRTLPGRAYWCLAFSPDGTRLAICGDKKLVEVGDASVSTYWTYLKLEGKNDSPKDLTFTAQSQDIATLWGQNPTGRLRKWNLTQQPPIEGHDDQEFSSVAFSGSITTALGLQREVRVLRKLGDELHEHRFDTPAGAADFLRIAKNGHDVFAVAGSTPEPQWSVKRLNADSGTETWSLEIPRKDFAAIAFSADDQLFALSRLDGRIELYDASSATKIRVLGTDRGPAHSLAFSPTQRRLASSTDQGVRVWDLETNQVLSKFTSEHESVDQIVYFPDGMRLATVCRADRTIRIWSMAEGFRELLTLPFPPHIAKHGRIGQMAISPDGRSIACFGTAVDGKWGVYLWQIPDSENGDHPTTVARSAQPRQAAPRGL
jgi:WD40 repeat protein